MQPLYLSSAYPTATRPHHGVFFRNLIQRLQEEWREDATVIRPVALSEVRHGMPQFGARMLSLPSGVALRQIYAPYLSLSSRRTPARLSGEVTLRLFTRAAHAAIKRYRVKADAVYGHFLLPGGLGAIRLGEMMGIPSFVALGESSFEVLQRAFSPGTLKELTADVSGVIAVSPANAAFARDVLAVPENRILTAPNGADTRLFQPMNRAAMRRSHGLPEQEILLAFVGAFETRKGPQRLLDAVRGMENIGVLLIGDGPLTLQSPLIRFKGRVEHKHLPGLLSAADIFVLPTLAEGSNNAIAEALACGLPIISSNRPFNHTLVSGDCAILVDPEDVNAIRQAVRELAGDPERQKQMSRNARAWAEVHSLQKRVVKIRNFLERRAQSHDVRRKNR